MVTDSYKFSGEYVASLTLIVFACVAMPILYYVVYAFRRRVNNIAFVAGVGTFIVLASLLGRLPPAAIAAVECAGMWCVMWLLSRRWDDTAVPVSFGLGFSVVTLVFRNGLNAILKLAQVNALNQYGLQATLESVEEEQREQLLSMLNELATETTSMHLIIAVEYVAEFALTVALCRLLWYSRGIAAPNSDTIRNNTQQWLFIALPFVLRECAELAYQRGWEWAYIAIAVVTVAAAVVAARRIDEPEVVSAPSLRRPTPKRKL